MDAKTDLGITEVSRPPSALHIRTQLHSCHAAGGARSLLVPVYPEGEHTEAQRAALDAVAKVLKTTGSEWVYEQDIGMAVLAVDVAAIRGKSMAPDVLPQGPAAALSQHDRDHVASKHTTAAGITTTVEKEVRPIKRPAPDMEKSGASAPAKKQRVTQARSVVAEKVSPAAKAGAAKPGKKKLTPLAKPPDREDELKVTKLGEAAFKQEAKRQEALRDFTLSGTESMVQVLFVPTLLAARRTTLTAQPAAASSVVNSKKFRKVRYFGVQTKRMVRHSI